MTAPQDLKRQLRNPGTHIEAIELTEEVRERLTQVSEAVIDLLGKRCKSPPEAYLVLDIVMGSFRDTYGIRDGFTLGKGEAGKS